jgi:SH3-like domain-containing protein
MRLPALALSLLPLLGLGLLAMPIAGLAQSGTLQVPPHSKPAEAPPKPPAAAPRVPVQAGPKQTTPVVQPHGLPHPQKPPPAKAAAHRPAVPPKAQTPPAPSVPPPPAPEAQAKPAEPTAPDKGTATGLPLPRFAVLRADDVNLRSGPGTRYPIEWVYKRRDLPVEIEREFENWRLIRDPEGIRGWVHTATLTGRRGFIIGKSEVALRRDAKDTASAVALLKPGVIGRIRSCQANSDWCQVQVGDYRGYLRREQFWGALPHEAINP